MKPLHYWILIILGFNALCLAENNSKRRPATKAPAPAPAKPAASPLPTKVSSTAEEADVAKIREKYWARGNETEMGVVQNRLYPKKRRFELGLGFGNLTGDPFLSILRYGVSLGYHFSEFISLHGMYWGMTVKPSSALTALESDTGQTANTNEPRTYMGGEARASVLYGKLSLLGSAILYFDSFFSLGAGIMKTETGSNLTLTGGIGQQIHITRTFSLNLDYKLAYYNERILGKVNSTTGNGNLGKDYGTRSNFSSVVTVSVSIFLNPFGA